MKINDLCSNWHDDEQRCIVDSVRYDDCMGDACDVFTPLCGVMSQLMNVPHSDNTAYDNLGNLAKELVIATLMEGESKGYANESEEAICQGTYDKGRDWLAHADTHIMHDKLSGYGYGNRKNNKEDHLAHALTDIVCEYRRRQLAQAQERKGDK